MTSPFSVSRDDPFSLANIPFGVYSTSSGGARCATRVGDHVVDLHELATAGYLSDVTSFKASVFSEATLNKFAALPHTTRKAVRERLQELLTPGSKLENDSPTCSKALKNANDVEMLLPVTVGDYTDFCASEFHTLNAGRLMKVPGPPLPPAWSHLPIGYAGRASSVVVSGTPIRRPQGVLPPSPTNPAPSYGPTKTLDMEYEMACIVGGPGNAMGDHVGVDDTLGNVFGLVIMNDWSAREIQGFEMVPLGPFNGKNFGTSISPWVVTLDALQPFKCSLPERTHKVETLSVFSHKDSRPTYDIPIEMTLKTSTCSEPTTIMKSNLKYLAYSFGQMIAHHTTSGCPIRAGDLLGSGTISGPLDDSLACLLEITERGAKPVTLSDGKTKRVWLEDGDEVVMTALARGEKGAVGFGVCAGKILPAK